MEHAYAELALAVFSTLAPLGAGTFVLLAVVFGLASGKGVGRVAGDSGAQAVGAAADGVGEPADGVGEPTGAASVTPSVTPSVTLASSPQVLKKIDLLITLPLILVAAGFIASFFHLGTPLNAFNTLNGIGRSPLSNELVAGIAFIIVAGSYWIVAMTGKLGYTVRKIWLALAGLAALVFVYFIGAAYKVSTIPTWDTPFAPLALIGYCLLGGVLLGLLVLQLSGALRDTSLRFSKPVLLSIAIVGALLASAGVVGQYLIVNSIATAGNSAIAGNTALVSAQVQAVFIWLIVFFVGMAFSLSFALFSLLRKQSTFLIVLGCLVVLGTVFVGRLIFYALYVNVGL